jgi:hypothetical protein
VLKYTSPEKTRFSDFSKAYKDLPGENLVPPANNTNQENYTVQATFKNHICVYDVYVQVNATNYALSNVAKIGVSYITMNGTVFTESDGTPLFLQSPDDNPTVTENKVRCGIQTIIVTILNTTDQTPPSAVRVVVDGCYNPGRKLFIYRKNKFSIRFF